MSGLGFAWLEGVVSRHEITGRPGCTPSSHPRAPARRARHPRRTRLRHTPLVAGRATTAAAPRAIATPIASRQCLASTENGGTFRYEYCTYQVLYLRPEFRCESWLAKRLCFMPKCLAL